jgi:hypothetical protein
MNGLYSSSTLTPAVSFNTTGLVTLPSWLSFTCPSTRTAQTSASTMIRGVAANQAVANMYGLQHEPTASNYCIYSENFAAIGWAANSLTMYSTSITDPAGNSTGCDAGVPTGSYGAGQSMSGLPTTFQPTFSGWIKSSGTSPNQANFGLLLSTTGYPTGNQIWQTPTTSWQRVSQTSPTVNSYSYTIIGDLRLSDHLGASRSEYAFFQCENNLYPTSYIPNTGATAVTRAASTLTFNLTNNAAFTLRFDVVMAVGSTSGLNQHLIRSPDATRYTFIDGTGHIGSKSGDYQVDSTALVWVAGDKLSFRMTYNNSTSYRIDVSKNGTPYYTNTFTHTVIPAYSNTGNFLASDNAGTVIACKGISYISLAQKPITKYSQRFDTVGNVAMNSNIQFSCASVRNPQISATTIQKGVAANQAFIASDGTKTGLLFETMATNYCQYSETFANAVWSRNGITAYSTTIADPAGNTTGADLGCTAASFGGASYIPQGSTIKPTFSGWIKSSGTTPNQTNIGLADYSFVYSTGNQIWLTPTTSWQKVSLTSPAAFNFAYTSIGDQRLYDHLGASRAEYAFFQTENTLYPTSYIVNSGTTAVTRAASNLTCNFTDTKNFTFELGFFAAVNSATMWLNLANCAGSILCQPTSGAFYGLYPSGSNLLFASYQAETIYDSHPITFSAGDHISIVYTFNGTTTYTAKLYINDPNHLSTPYLTTTITHTTVPTFLPTGNIIGSLTGNSYTLATTCISQIIVS